MRLKPPPPDDVAAAVRALAGSIRAGTPPVAALAGWDEVAPSGITGAVARAVALGEAPAPALRRAEASLGPAAPALARCFSLHRAAGGSLPALLDRVAVALERDAAEGRTSRAVTSGARLSARLVAALPLAFAPLTSAGSPFRSGPAGVAVMVAGVALGGVGLWWIGRLVPRQAAGDDGPAALAEDLAAALRGGVGLVPALEAAARHRPPGLEAELERAARRVALGEPWVAALRREGGALGSLAEVVARCRSWGLPAVRPLRQWARTRRAEVATERQRALRRAPVLMVVPLTLCVLPSFALLAFGPFVLGALGAR